MTPHGSQLWFDYAFASKNLKLLSDFHGRENQVSAVAEAVFTELQRGSVYASLPS